MKIEMRKLSDVKPYEKNPRINDNAVDSVAASIKEFGFRQPIVVDKDGVIIIGHTRWKAAQKLGLEDVPVHVADLDAEKTRALRIADNKLNELSEWDLELLPIELKDLQSMDVDLCSLGFDLTELEKLLGVAAHENFGQTDADDIPEVSEQPISVRGAIYQLGRHRLMVGDSTSESDVKLLMGDGRAQMCFTDPPWNVAIGLDSNPRHRQREGLQNDNLDSASFMNFLSGFIRNMRSFVEGDLYCVLGAAEWPTLDATLRAEGYHWSATIIWAKDAFVLGRSKYHRRYEPIWYGWHEKGKSSFGTDRTEDDVWEVPRPRRSDDHPTMKPVQLVERALKNSSAPGQLIYEPFGGSGTTLLAAERLGRACNAMEIEPRFADVIRRRWAEFTFGVGCDWATKTPAIESPTLSVANS